MNSLIGKIEIGVFGDPEPLWIERFNCKERKKLEKTDKELEELYKKFLKIPTFKNEENIKCIGEKWGIWSKGTPIDDIEYYFYAQHSDFFSLKDKYKEKDRYE